MNFTSKYDVIESLLKTYDELDRLRAENERLKRVNADMKSIDSVDDEEDPRAYQKARIMEYGRKEIMKNSTSYWDSVMVKRGDEGQLIVQEFADWRKGVINRTPEFMSCEDFYVLMDAELRETYELRKLEAIDKLVESERESDGE
jgi:hypothetical protein|nr:MAG TPA: hypothetical protein [Caudoviricetes sp.]